MIKRYKALSTCAPVMKGSDTLLVLDAEKRRKAYLASLKTLAREGIFVTVTKEHVEYRKTEHGNVKY